MLESMGKPVSAKICDEKSNVVHPNVQYGIEKVNNNRYVPHVSLQLPVRQDSAISPTRPTAESFTNAATANRTYFLAPTAQCTTRLLQHASTQEMPGENSQSQPQPGDHC